ncbi:MAG: isopenicillin N synthase family oxygenase [Verrucomicrobia bacterium]|nr:isopenicillin N synthase family oxygenase [Verrucomicrobiota bacterium]MBS0636696.1 isopenicillin N synthase family oxygenase [Verrucomicrobiota bacterium]
MQVSAVSQTYYSQPEESKITEMGEAANLHDSTIPVIDLFEFTHAKQHFVEKVSRALQEVGFFALVNTGIDQEVLDASYRASEQFFSADPALKAQIHKPDVHGQRGLVYSEVAQGETAKDKKEFIHIGKTGNFWPEWMDLEKPMMGLMKELDKIGQVLQRALALAIGEEEEFLLKQTEGGDNLLRALWYPKNPGAESMGAAPHTDIDDITLLPMSTADGLQVLHDKKWVPVKVPPNAVIVNGGDKLKNLTNGLFESAWHRVKMDPNQERRSIVYFVHPRPNDSRGPTAKCIERTGGIQRYPEATSWELLACRLRELKLLTDPAVIQPLDAPGGIMERISALVQAGDAARPVQRTFILWQRTQPQ